MLDSSILLLMRQTHFRSTFRIFLALSLTAPAAMGQSASAARKSISVVPEDRMVEVIAKQFEASSLVGLGELHGSRPDHELRIKLIHDQRFLANVRNIVVESMNSLYLEDLDRYIQGEEFPKERVQRVWRDSTQVFAGPAMLTAYEEFLNEVRAANLGLPEDRRIRVIAADPPIDWTNVRSHDDFRAFLRRRVDFGAEVIEREVLRKGGKALLVFGAGHFVRNQRMKTPNGFVPVVPTIASLIDGRFPKHLYVVAQIRGNSEASDRKLETMIGTAHLPVLLRLQSSDFGQLDPNEYNPLNTSVLLGAPPAMFPQFREGLRLADVADAVIYRGPTGNPLI